MATRLKRYLKSFTLIELIIVIAIIAVLGATAFLLLTQWMSKGRDASKISTIRTIKTALEINFTARGEYPLPQDAVEHTGANGTKLYQGYVGANMVAELQKTPIDPTTKKPYVYSYMKLNGGQGYYQIGTTLENTVGYNGYELAKADISTTAKVVGNYEFDPSLPSLIIVGGNESTRGIYDPSNCYVLDGGKNTVDGTQCEPKKDMPLKEYDNGLVGYWDMESITDDGKLKDISGNGNNGTFSGLILPTLTGSYIGGGMSFTGSHYTPVFSYIEIPHSNSLNLNEHTIQVLLKINDNFLANIILSKGTMDSRPCVFSGSYICENYMIAYNPGNKQIQGASNSSGIRNISRTNLYNLHSTEYSLITVKYFKINNFYAYDIFYNGIKQNSVYQNNTSQLPFYNNKSLTIGGRLFTSGTPTHFSQGFNGIIDEVKIYNRALSASEILQQAKIAGF